MSTEVTPSSHVDGWVPTEGAMRFAEEMAERTPPHRPGTEIAR